MKKMFLSATCFTALILIACNSNNSSAHEDHDASSTTADSADKAGTPVADIRQSSVTYPNLDAKASASIHQIAQHYLHVKNALASDNAAEAATGAGAIIETMKHLDKSLLTAEQKTTYDATESSLAEEAEYISKKTGDIENQRSHFATLSNAVYSLIKDFGAGLPIYHDHCPMYNENKGAMWLSEVKEIKNPYYGSEMPTCGKVEEVIR